MEEAKKKIKWTFQALEHVSSIEEYISSFDNLIADDFVNDLFEKVGNDLSNFPERNPPCRFKKLQAAGYKCMTFRKKYFVVYKEYEYFVSILAVMYSGRNPKAFNDLI